MATDFLLIFCRAAVTIESDQTIGGSCMNPEYERTVISITDEDGVDYELEVLAVA